MVGSKILRIHDFWEEEQESREQRAEKSRREERREKRMQGHTETFSRHIHTDDVS